MVSIANSQYWEQRYQEGTDRWDLGKASPPLVSLLNSPELALKRGRVAVLGCGRGYDAMLFADRGFDTIGFDFAPLAITEATTLAQTTSNSARFLQRNIFDLADEFPTYFDYVIEHTCFCAIEPNQRLNYVQIVQQILQPQGELIGIFFTHDRAGGPPFGVTPTQIKQYFQPKFEIISLLPVLNSVPERQGEEHLGRFRVKELS